MSEPHYDLAVIGAGILGLAHALAAARRGLRVAVIDRDAAANGASIRNFGFVTVTGQEAGACWDLAMRSRGIWAEIAQAASIPILQRGLLVTARRPEAEAVIEAFLATPMGQACRWMTPAEAARYLPNLKPDGATAALFSPHELRVESRTALPRIAAWLSEAHDVQFYWQQNALSVSAGLIEIPQGRIRAEAVVACPGDDLAQLWPQIAQRFAVTRCKLQMLRVRPARPRPLASAVMSDLGLARYRGYAALPAAAALASRLDDEQPGQRENGVHLIVVQSADGSLVVGDSHHYGATPDPFLRREIDRLILAEMEAVLDLGPYTVAERWAGTYASAPDRWRLCAQPDPQTRVVVVTAGCGASTAFGIGEETVASLFGRKG
ncbi:MAG: TIGR03364 family FAD-dependent oxidoreductase [Pseudomonadota bacterium]